MFTESEEQRITTYKAKFAESYYAAAELGFVSLSSFVNFGLEPTHIQGERDSRAILETLAREIKCFREAELRYMTERANDLRQD